MKALGKFLSPILLAILMAVGIGLFIISPATQQLSVDSEWNVTATRILGGSLEGPFPSPVPNQANPRRTAAFSGLLISLLLCLLYAYRRRRYIAEWAGAWMLLSCSMLMLSRGYENPDQLRLALAVLVLSRVVIRLLLFRSAHSFNGTVPYSNKYWLSVPLLFVWLLEASGRFSVATVVAPIYILSGFIDSRTSILFASAFRRQRMVGALILSLTMGVIGLTNLAFGFFVTDVVRSRDLFLLFLNTNSLCFLVGAFGMHLLIFEEMAHELKSANRELKEAHEELRRLAAVDALTGCYNRRFFEENIDREMQRHRRYGTPLCLLFIDIDRFKHVRPDDLYRGRSCRKSKGTQARVR